MSTRKRGDDPAQLPLFQETEPDWIRTDNAGHASPPGGMPAAHPLTEGEKSGDDTDGRGDDLEQFARWLKRQKGREAE